MCLGLFCIAGTEGNTVNLLLNRRKPYRRRVTLTIHNLGVGCSGETVTGVITDYRCRTRGLYESRIGSNDLVYTAFNLTEVLGVGGRRSLEQDIVGLTFIDVCLREPIYFQFRSVLGSRNTNNVSVFLQGACSDKLRAPVVNRHHLLKESVSSSYTARETSNRATDIYRDFLTSLGFVVRSCKL